MLTPCLLALLAADAGWISQLGGRVEGDSVSLRGTWVTDADLIELAAMAKLRRLDLSHTRITDEGLLHLKPASQIEELVLYYAEQVSDQGMNAIKDWTRLRVLDVRGTRIADGTLAVVGGLKSIEWLDIANTNVTDNGLDHLVGLTRLKHLALGRSRLSETATATVRLLNTLESLDLSGPRSVNRNQRTSAANLPEELVAAIAELKALRVLKLGHLPVDATALGVLASALPNLEKLGLEGCARVDDKALESLKGLAKLRWLDAQETAATRQGVDALRSAIPGLVVVGGR
jgi:Leucine-rich repeat (LRR) protein